MTSQIAPGVLQYVDRGQGARSGPAHAPELRQRVFRPRVVSAQPPDARELVIGERLRLVGDDVFAVTSQHSGQRVPLDSDLSHV
jgi:hypothetical protein